MNLKTLINRRGAEKALRFCRSDFSRELQMFATNPHFSPGSREQAQDSCSSALLWSEKRSNSYGLSEEQAYGHED